ncbi:GNAT family N-acetyltransferase [Peristeroidobacter soli]|jgi:ElaA protein|uniref:GNAT family N-acetyltransferase n=1 Tax=Peristeroidobacter soli TaxID=2497877 RepID=UPI00101C13B8|nr:GNAT family N-acetyltransferase [Peristeroidobacter soli]
MDINWQWRRYAELSPLQIHTIFAARQAVFIVEQACAYPDIDDKDLQALHLAGWAGAQLAAYLRLLAPGVSYPDEPSLGRIITTRLARGGGVGRELVARGLEKIHELYPTLPTRIGAQAHLHKFYGSFGFVQASEPYDEDGIMHIEMLRAAGPVAPRA